MVTTCLWSVSVWTCLHSIIVLSLGVVAVISEPSWSVAIQRKGIWCTLWRRDLTIFCGFRFVVHNVFILSSILVYQVVAHSFSYLIPYSLESKPTSKITPNPLFSSKFHLKALLLRLYAHLKINFTEHAQSFYAWGSRNSWLGDDCCHYFAPCWRAKTSIYWQKHLSFLCMCVYFEVKKVMNVWKRALLPWSSRNSQTD